MYCIEHKVSWDRYDPILFVNTWTAVQNICVGTHTNEFSGDYKQEHPLEEENINTAYI
jgi:hypothetical protein